ncbi:MAG: hypothetical protein M3Z75_17960 [Actinomycetota bacterium]|nr:hypothetical protein [Actinomycetota bacterium]
MPAGRPGPATAGDTVALRGTVAGLLGLAAAEELTLLAATAFRSATDREVDHSSAEVYRCYSAPAARGGDDGMPPGFWHATGHLGDY